MSARRRKFYGWGYADEGAAPDEIRLLERTLAARIQCGVLGRELEAQLKPHGFTLRLLIDPDR